MAIEEYKDVIRIEKVQGLLNDTLRKQQLGFERIKTGNGTQIQMGYKDSEGVMHYLDESGAGGDGYWEPYDHEIKYEQGDVAIGSDNANRRLEVTDQRYTTTS